MDNLLYLQANHRSAEVLAGNPVTTVCAYPSTIRLPRDDRYKQYVTMSGLDNVSKIGRVAVDDALVSALVERWRQETHTFHMPVGELTVTLEDVAVLYGLPVDGEAVCQRTDQDWPAVVLDLLGRVDETTFKEEGNIPKRIKVSWLVTNFSRCPENADNYTVQRYARAYLLMLAGTVLFPCFPRDSIPSLYLPLFEDFQNAGRYSWASAVLAFLYRELCSATDPTRRLFNGASMLLQMWCWMRFPFGRPENAARSFVTLSLSADNGNEKLPLGCFLTEYRSFDDHTNAAKLVAYRHAIDRLDESEVIWQPYEDTKNLVPRICAATPELWTTTAPLVHFWIVETYNPHRVMRQFGRYQNIPPLDRNTSVALHGIQNGAGNDRPVVHAAHLSNWRDRWSCCLLEARSYAPSEHDAYMKWFSHVSILYLHGSPEADE